MAKTIDEIKTMLKTEPAYAFLQTDKHLGGHIIMLGLGGSYAYGTQTDHSDVDIRGIAAPTAADVLLARDFEQVVDTPTDTVVYSLRKICGLLASCNPNTIEMLGIEDWQVLYATPYWQLLRDNKEIFLSRKAITAFGGYASAQLRRLQNREARYVGQSKREKHVLDSIRTAEQYLQKSLPATAEVGEFSLYIDDSVKQGMEKEIYVDVEARHYPLRDYCALISNYNGIVRDYDKLNLGSRNRKALEHGKIAKHMMHLARLYLMCFDILEKHEINTYRKHDIGFLMDIRSGKYLNAAGEVIPEFYELVDDFEARLKRDAAETDLPEQPDYDRIHELLLHIHREIVVGQG